MPKINDIPQESKSNIDLGTILARLESLEKENKKLIETLENDKNPYAKARERYKGPRHYSYKMWGTVPVLKYKSIKKDKTKDWTYKNQYGQFVNNHYLMIELANNEKVELDIHEFSSNYTFSEKQECQVMTDGFNTLGYKFKTEEFGEFVVDVNAIN